MLRFHQEKAAEVTLAAIEGPIATGAASDCRGDETDHVTGC